jgi:hypothetical protein
MGEGAKGGGWWIFPPFSKGGAGGITKCSLTIRTSKNLPENFENTEGVLERIYERLP